MFDYMFYIDVCIFSGKSSRSASSTAHTHSHTNTLTERTTRIFGCWNYTEMSIYIYSICMYMYANVIYNNNNKYISLIFDLTDARRSHANEEARRTRILSHLAPRVVCVIIVATDFICPKLQ